MLRQAQQILAYGDSWVLKDKFDKVPYSPYHGQDFVGPVKVKHVRVPRPDADGGTRQHLQPVFRTVLCLQRTVPGRDASVWQSTKTKNCSWHDLIACGSPWTCPLCSARINLARREQITRVYEAVKSHTVGGCAYMLTFTVRHGIGDDCKLLVSNMKDAMQLLQKRAEWKAATRRKALVKPRAGSIPFLDYIGRIAALEATHGANGWHPHEHHLWFFKKKLSAQKINLLRKKLFLAWAECCVAVGLEAPLEKYGLDVREALSAAEYIAKFAELGNERRWGPEKEIASSHVKKGNKKGRSVMQILSDSMRLNDDVASSSSLDFEMNSDAFLFLDFANAFLGRHQLQMSRTLKTFLREFGIDIDETEQGDLDLAHALEADSELQFEVTASDFRCIVRNKAQATVLFICKSQGADAAFAFICSLPGRIDSSSDDDGADDYITDLVAESKNTWQKGSDIDFFNENRQMTL
jgi:hypothetical protein